MFTKRGDKIMENVRRKQINAELKRLNHEADIILAKAIAGKPYNNDELSERLRKGSF